jgi:para-nitrobenzyl esterase
MATHRVTTVPSRAPRPLAVLAAALAVALVGCTAPAAPTGGADGGTTGDPAVVVAPAGPLRGTATEGHRRFQAVPYAAPPVGDLRWRSPRPAPPWEGVRDATAPGSPCPQTWGPAADGRPEVTGSEDCLHLTVDTPLPAGPRPWPVMVFLHGGGTAGQGGLYDPRRVVTQGGVVVVTVNARLGALGHLAHPALDDPAVGNLGLADRQAALRWVRDNIAAFGGDPGDVTLWGESAGGFAACALLASPGTAGLVHKAIVQSATCANPVVAREAAEQRALDTASGLGCPDPGAAADCLRALPVEALVGIREADSTTNLFPTIAAAPWWPVAGTPLLPQQPLDALRSGAAAGVPLLHGATRDEMTARVAARYDAAGAPLTAEQYPQVLVELFGPEVGAAVAAEYPLAAHPSPSAALAAALGDQGGMVGACTQLPVYALPGRTVYGYQYAQPSGRLVGAFDLGAHHGADVPLFFDSTMPGRPPAQRTPPVQALSERLIRWWTAFARTGAPGDRWRPVGEAGVLRVTAAGADPVALDVLAREHRCDFWVGTGS